MIDHEQFLQHAITIARANLPYCGGDTARATQTALQEAHTNLSQQNFFAAIDALGGHESVRQQIIDALTHYPMPTGGGRAMPPRCICHNRYTICEIHDPLPPYLSVEDWLRGCTCQTRDLFNWGPTVVRELCCPRHGAPAYRSRP